MWTTNLRRRALWLVATAAFVVSLAACQTPRTLTLGEEAIERTTAAYRAYERGDCGAVESGARAAELVNWTPNEARHSFVLLRGFCWERDGDPTRARETYRSLIREAPLSFASDDARERLRILRLLENDPGYGAWLAQARQRALEGSTSRAAVDRVPASFPPMAQRAGIEGYAVVEFGVTPRGNTDAPVVVESSPPILFDGVALRAVRAWRYSRDLGGTESDRQAIRLVFVPRDESPGEGTNGSGEPTDSALQ